MLVMSFNMLIGPIHQNFWQSKRTEYTMNQQVEPKEEQNNVDWIQQQNAVYKFEGDHHYFCEELLQTWQLVGGSCAELVDELLRGEIHVINYNYYKCYSNLNQLQSYIVMIKITHNFYKLLHQTIHHSFANFIVNNPTTGQPCAQFEKFQGEEQMKKQDQAMEEGRRKWKVLSVSARKQKLAMFVQALEKNKQQMVSTMLNSTGKHRQYAELQFEASVSALKQDLSQKYPGTIHKKSGVYYFKSFGNILVVCDYRMVLLNCIKYLVSCGIAGNSLILNPHRYGLPIGKKLQQIWRTTLPQYPLIYCPVNNFTDGLEYLVHKKDMGFISFSGDIEQGNKFYHFMAQKSEILAESEFLLMSSDCAYVLKDLSDDHLKKAAQNLSLACFMAGGNLFNSIKRIFVDEQISVKFTQYFIEASKQYKINTENSKISPIITANHIAEAKKHMQELKEFKGNQLKVLTQLETKQSYKSLYVSPIVYQVDGIPSIEYWNKIYTMPVCFIEKVTSHQRAVEQINSSIYGISSTIYSDNKANIHEIGSLLDVGVVNGNRWGFTPGVPYSPRKRSGKGHSFSVLSYTNVTKSQSLKGFYESAQ